MNWPALSAALNSSSYRPWFDAPPTLLKIDDTVDAPSTVAVPELLPPLEFTIWYSKPAPTPKPYVPLSFPRIERKPFGIPTEEPETFQPQPNVGSIVVWFHT